MPIEIRHDFTNARGRQIRRPKGDGGGMARSAAQPRSRFSASHALRWREAHLREGVPAPAQRIERPAGHTDILGQKLQRSCIQSSCRGFGPRFAGARVRQDFLSNFAWKAAPASGRPMILSSPENSFRPLVPVWLT